MNDFLAGLLWATAIYLPCVVFLFFKNCRLYKEKAMDWALFRNELKAILAQRFVQLIQHGLDNGHISKDELVAEAKQDALVAVGLVAASPAVVSQG